MPPRCNVLHSGDPAFAALRIRFEEHVGPALRMLLDSAVAAGQVHDGEDPLELLGAVANLCVPAPGSTAASIPCSNCATAGSPTGSAT